MKKLTDRIFGRPRLFSVGEETQRAVARTGDRPSCDCLSSQHAKLGKCEQLSFHYDCPDANSSAWIKMLELVDQAARDGRETFEPGADFEWDEWTKLTTLPASIGNLKNVRSMLLYGSNLVSIPPQIGDMTNLSRLDLYTSYRLHWLPYEITRCFNLADTRISTRALYGNYKHRLPFPELRPYVNGFEPETCSICDGLFDKFEDHRPQQFWISLKVGTDVLPLLVHACSRACVDRLPSPHEGYIAKPHKGGIGQAQPKPR